MPLQRITATLGVLSITSLPKIAATLAITGVPPTGHRSSSNDSALTQASAKPLHPGYPHPPQLAPGSTSSTCPFRGSSYTLNFCATKYRITALIAPIAPSEKVAINTKFMCLFYLKFKSFCLFFLQCEYEIFS